MLKRIIAPVKNTWFYKHKWKFIIGTPLIGYGSNWQWEEYNYGYKITNFCSNFSKWTLCQIRTFCEFLPELCLWTFCELFYEFLYELFLWNFLVTVLKCKTIFKTCSGNCFGRRPTVGGWFTNKNGAYNP